MQVSIETTTGLERRLTIGVPAERIESEVNKRLQKAAGNARIDGFRPGKVPFGVIKKKYGGQVQAEVLNDMMQSCFYEAVSQEKLRPAGVPMNDANLLSASKSAIFVSRAVAPSISNSSR